MSSFNEKLEMQWELEKERLKSMDYEKQKDVYKIQANRVGELEKLLVDLERVELEVEGRAASQDIEEKLKSQQMVDDKKDRLFRNMVEIAKVVVPAVGAFVMCLISMQWEKTDTITSSAGKSSLRDTLRFKS